MRTIHSVVQAIIKEVPDSFGYKDILIEKLENLLDSACYRAPELNYLNFQQCSEILEEYLGEPNNKWKRKIVDIFAGKIAIE